MDKVFVVLEAGNDIYEVLFNGVYKTEQQAQKRIDEIVKDHPSAKESLYIEEVKLEDNISEESFYSKVRTIIEDINMEEPDNDTFELCLYLREHPNDEEAARWVNSMLAPNVRVKED